MLQKYIYFTAIPHWKNNNLSFREKINMDVFPGDFIGDDSICRQKFGSIFATLEAMKNDGTCLREKNWAVKGYYWMGLAYHNIPLSELYRLRLIAAPKTDSISLFYDFL